MKKDNTKCRNDGRFIPAEFLSEEVQASFRFILKQGIYKELHNRKLLSNEQLYALMNK